VYRPSGTLGILRVRIITKKKEIFTVILYLIISVHLGIKPIA
jgi:hypothetical protein